MWSQEWHGNFPVVGENWFSWPTYPFITSLTSSLIPCLWLLPRLLEWQTHDRSCSVDLLVFNHRIGSTSPHYWWSSTGYLHLVQAPSVDLQSASWICSCLRNCLAGVYLLLVCCTAHMSAVWYNCLFRHNNPDSSLVPWWRNNLQSFIRAGTTLSIFKRSKDTAVLRSPALLTALLFLFLSTHLLSSSYLSSSFPLHSSGLEGVCCSHCFQLHSGLIMYLTINCSGQKPLLKY